MIRNWWYGPKDDGKLAELDRVTRDYYLESVKVDNLADKLRAQHDDPLSALAANMRRSKWRQ